MLSKRTAVEALVEKSAVEYYGAEEAIATVEEEAGDDRCRCLVTIEGNLNSVDRTLVHRGTDGFSFIKPAHEDGQKWYFRYLLIAEPMPELERQLSVGSVSILAAHETIFNDE